MAMQLTQSMGVRMEQRQLLTPRMIQSMEILQLPLMALEERIEQELQNNPVLELREGGEEVAEEPPITDSPDGEGRKEDFSESEQPMVVKENSDQSEDFERLARIGEYFENEDFANSTGSNFRVGSYDGERDKKLDAMNNTAARGITLQEHLTGQWAFVETTAEIRAAGAAIINVIDADGYLRTELADIARDSKRPLTIEALEAAL